MFVSFSVFSCVPSFLVCFFLFIWTVTLFVLLIAAFAIVVRSGGQSEAS